MNGRNLTLAHVFGIEIRVNISWVFIAMLLSWALAQGYFPTVHEGLGPIDYWSMSIIAVLGLFLSILLHELSHSVVARAFGMEIKSITLWLLGGMAEMRDEPPHPRAEFLMALAGPAMSLVLAGLFSGIGGLLAPGSTLELVGAVLVYLGKLNLVLAIFNLMPAFPLDGGRVARAVLWAVTGDYERATGIAARMGSIFGLSMIALGVIMLLTGAGLSSLWLVILGLFIRFAADASLTQVHTKHALAGVQVRDAMTSNPITVSPAITVGDLINDYIYKHAFEFFPVVENGHLTGSVSLHEVKQVPPAERAGTRVKDIARPLEANATIGVDATAAQALAAMQEAGKSLLMVTDNGQLVGVIGIRDVMRLVSLKSMLAER